MSRGRQLSESDKEAVQAKSRKVAEILIRGGRAYIAAVRAPSRAENVQAEDRFIAAVEDFAIFCIESGFGD